MTLTRAAVLMSIAILTVSAGAALAESNAPKGSNSAASTPAVTLQMPAIPEPVRVALQPATTAMLVSDMVDPTCKVQPRCMETMLPAVIGLLERARKAGVFVVFSTRATNKWLPELTPASGDPTVVPNAQDRFYNSELDKILKARNINTIILTGWKISGSVLYTSIGATLRDYTVVVPADASKATTDYEEIIGLYQLLNQNSANATNQPLKPKASTLTRTDMITFQ